MPWEPEGKYGPEGDGITVWYKDQPAHEPYRGEAWRRSNLRHDGTGRFRVYQLAQLAYILSVESTADREHGGPVDRALNLQ